MGVAGVEMVKAIEAWPPPGIGFDTSNCMVPGTASSVGATAVVNCEELTKVTFCGAPFHVRVEPARKFDPLMPKVNPPLPAASVFGEMEAMAGKGFCCEGELEPPQEESSRERQITNAKAEHKRTGEIGWGAITRLTPIGLVYLPVLFTCALGYLKRR
jgi:hypothetical protein